jgi:hypothetical protein
MNEEGERQALWCGRCRCCHAWSPPFDMDALADKMAQEMADEIDREIFDEMMKGL